MFQINSLELKKISLMLLISDTIEMQNHLKSFRYILVGFKC